MPSLDDADMTSGGFGNCGAEAATGVFCIDSPFGLASVLGVVGSEFFELEILGDA